MSTVTGSRPANIERALRLEYLSITWNVAEAFVGVIAGAMAGSVALLGFALDSVAESSSAGILIWRLRSERRSSGDADRVERRAIRLVALAFFGLAAYVAGRAAYQLIVGIRPAHSLLGIGLAVISVVGMPVLAYYKRKAAWALNSRSLQADSRQTMLCTYISILLLVGLAANALLGWWWADPVAGIGIAAIAVREGWQLWTTEDLCCV